MQLIHKKVSTESLLSGRCEYEEEECLYDCRDILGKCVLLKACLSTLQMILSSTTTISEWLRNTYDRGLRIITESYIPTGSGLGGSSVLAAAVLAALIKLLCLQYTKHDIIQMVPSTFDEISY